MFRDKNLVRNHEISIVIIQWYLNYSFKTIKTQDIFNSRSKINNSNGIAETERMENWITSFSKKYYSNKTTFYGLTSFYIAGK